VATLAVSACSQSTDAAESTGDASTAYAYAGTEADTNAARSAGELAAAKAGGSTDLPAAKKVGLILLSGQSASSVRIETAVKQIAQLLNWEVTTCDPDFDTQKLQQCATSILSQGPDLIISASQNPTQVASALQTARDRGIPWFGTLSGGTQVAGFYDYGIDGTKLAEITNDWMLSRLKVPNPSRSQQILAFTAPTVGVANLNQQEQLVSDVNASGSAELAVVHDINLSNAAQDVLSTTTQTLQQRRDLGAVWTVCDFCLPLISQAVRQAQAGDRSTMIVGTFSTPASIDGIRSGAIDAVGEYAWETQAWAAVDQALEYMARGTAIAPDFSVFDTYGAGLMKPYILDKESVGATGSGPILGADYEAFFRAKWKTEFGVA